MSHPCFYVHSWSVFDKSWKLSTCMCSLMLNSNPLLVSPIYSHYNHRAWMYSFLCSLSSVPLLLCNISFIVILELNAGFILYFWRIPKKKLFKWKVYIPNLEFYELHTEELLFFVFLFSLFWITFLGCPLFIAIFMMTI